MSTSDRNHIADAAEMESVSAPAVLNDSLSNASSMTATNTPTNTTPSVRCRRNRKAADLDNPLTVARYACAPTVPENHDGSDLQRIELADGVDEQQWSGGDRGERQRNI